MARSLKKGPFVHYKLEKKSVEQTLKLKVNQLSKLGQEQV